MRTKGVIGLDTVKMVIVALLILAVAVVAFFALLNPLQNTANTLDTLSATVVNETAIATKAGDTLDTSTTYGWSNVVITGGYNATSGAAIPAGNLTIVNGTRLTNGTSLEYEAIKVSYTYNYYGNGNRLDSSVGNLTTGTTSFFAQVPTFMVLLAVVVIILLIGIVIVVVTRFQAPENRGL